MAEYTADFEAGTLDNTITTAGGEASATAWTRVFGTSVYSNTYAAHGTLAARLDSTANWGLIWDKTFASDSYGRFYFYATQNPAALSYILRITGGGQTALIQVGTDGKLDALMGSDHAYGSVAIALNQWIRIEFRLFADVTNGVFEVKLFNSAGSATATETIGSATRNTGASAPTELDFPCGGGNGGNWGAYTWLDDAVANATSYPGPVPVATTGRTYKRLYGPAQLTDSATDLYTCPASTVARTLHIHASNPSGSPVDVNLSIGADAAATRVWDDLATPADGIKDVFDPYELTAGEKIQGWADTAGTVVVTITGYEDPV